MNGNYIFQTKKERNNETKLIQLKFLFVYIECESKRDILRLYRININWSELLII